MTVTGAWSLRPSLFVPIVADTARAARSGAGQLVVQAPAAVELPRSAPVGPPAVRPLVGVQTAPDVDPALPEQGGEPGALVGQEAAVLLVGRRVVDIELGVGDVEVAAQHHRPPRVEQRLGVLEEVRHEALLLGLAGVTAAAAGQVHAHHARLGQVDLHDPPLGVGPVQAEALPGVLDGDAGPHRHARVALLLCIALGPPPAPRRSVLPPHLRLLHAQLLQGDDVGALSPSPAVEALAQRGPEPVGVQCRELPAHRSRSSSGEVAPRSAGTSVGSRS